MDIQKIIDKSIMPIIQREAAEINKFIVGYFGSVEEAKKQANDYVIEVYSTDWTEKTINNDNFVFQIESRYRLRKKTPEEKLAEESQKTATYDMDQLDDQGKMCVLNGHHRNSVDSDGYCDYCGNQ